MDTEYLDLAVKLTFNPQVILLTVVSSSIIKGICVSRFAKLKCYKVWHPNTVVGV